MRETLEETAHALEPSALVGIYRWRHEPSGTTFLRFAIAGSVHGPDAGRALDKEIVATHWLTPGELAARRAMHRSPLVARCVADYVAGARFPLDVLSREFA